jgi:Zn-finger nucleic acid-binding protein
MNCPVDHGSLRTASLASGLLAFVCATCGGQWLRFGDYLAWREKHPGDQPEVPSGTTGELEAATVAGVRRCPDCGYLLTRYELGHDLAFSLDRCGRCNGIWFDKAEWDVLEARGLHDNLREMFNPSWQTRVRAEERERRAAVRLTEHLGSDATRVREFAEWVATHPRRNEILAYIQSTIR